MQAVRFSHGWARRRVQPCTAIDIVLFIDFHWREESWHGSRGQDGLMTYPINDSFVSKYSVLSSIKMDRNDSQALV